jgi:predicted nucleic acid-binding protein
MSIFIDTSGLIAVMDRDEANHAAAAEAWRDILTSSETLITTNYVLLETMALAQNRLGIASLKLLHEDIVPALRIEWIDRTVHNAAMAALLSASRRKLSLVDCVSFEVMRLLGVTTAFAFDKHFNDKGFLSMPAYLSSGDTAL